MTLEDCRNYRKDFRECVEKCITGELGREQALRLLKSRHEFDLPNEDFVPKGIWTCYEEFVALGLPNSRGREKSEMTDDIRQFFESYTEAEIEAARTINAAVSGIPSLYKYCKKEIESL